MIILQHFTFQLKGNIQQFFAKFLQEGKATVRLGEPPHDICLSKVMVILFLYFRSLLCLFVVVNLTICNSLFLQWTMMESISIRRTEGCGGGGAISRDDNYYFHMYDII